MVVVVVIGGACGGGGDWWWCLLCLLGGGGCQGNCGSDGRDKHKNVILLFNLFDVEGGRKYNSVF